MEIRDATLDDVPALTVLHNELIASTTFTWTERPLTEHERRIALEARNVRSFPTLVAVVDGAVVGTAGYGDFRDSVRWPGYRFTVEHSVFVLESAWGTGVGRALMYRLFERARSAGIHAMIGGIDASNAQSLRFHERLGFREVARMPETGWKHGHWCDLVFVQRPMDASGAPR